MHGLGHTARALALVILALMCFTRPSLAQSATAETAGPSQALFNSPFYSCIRTFYVSPTGNDSNPGTSGSPWKSLQRADSASHGRIAGDCVIATPGTYTTGVNIQHGGNAATATGYVVYRCQVMDQCKITATGGNAAPVFNIINEGSGPNFIVIDGFEMAAASQQNFGVGVFTDNTTSGAPTATPSVHHLWVLNNIIYGYGQAGVNTNESDWLFVMHNTAYQNAGVSCGAQGSGITFVGAKATPNYTSTAADLQWAPFHQVVSWNITYDNEITQCGNASNPYDTDGNGIIMDTFNGAGVDNVLYPNQTLVANNVTYNNGGKGIQVFRSSYVTVANNTAYDNNLDPWNSGTARGEITNAGGTFNTYINNVASPVPATSTADPRCKGADYNPAPEPCPLMDNAAFVGGSSAGVTDAGNQWTNNISFGGTPPFSAGPLGNAMFGNDTMSCTLGLINKCNVNPLLISPSTGNFALQTTSPAIGFGTSITTILTALTTDLGLTTHHTLTTC